MVLYTKIEQQLDNFDEVLFKYKKKTKKLFTNTFVNNV